MPLCETCKEACRWEGDEGWCCWRQEHVTKHHGCLRWVSKWSRDDD